MGLHGAHSGVHRPIAGKLFPNRGVLRTDLRGVSCSFNHPTRRKAKKTRLRVRAELDGGRSNIRFVVTFTVTTVRTVPANFTFACSDEHSFSHEFHEHKILRLLTSLHKIIPGPRAHQRLRATGAFYCVFENPLLRRISRLHKNAYPRGLSPGGARGGSRAPVGGAAHLRRKCFWVHGADRGVRGGRGKNGRIRRVVDVRDGHRRKREHREALM